MLTVLAHAGSNGALGRITRFLELTDAPAELIAELPSRLHIVETDLGQPRMGLATAAFERLADELDVIWHSAGNINLDDDLAKLRRVNVEGTRNVLELAAAGCRNRFRGRSATRRRDLRGRAGRRARLRERLRAVQVRG
jgi:thioester reductase-like protein